VISNGLPKHLAFLSFFSFKLLLFHAGWKVHVIFPNGYLTFGVSLWGRGMLRWVNIIQGGFEKGKLSEEVET
jgi:hypothetical protein